MMTPNPTKNTTATMAATALFSATICALITASIISRRNRKYATIISKLEETRSSERKGRIRAEMKLRTHLKNMVGAGELATDLDEEIETRCSVTRSDHILQLHCIGTIVSPFTKRMGTPRQGALVPSGRGYIQLNVPVECLEGMESYSHAWIIFTFHANTDNPVTTTLTRNTGDTTKLNLTKTKIRPPRGNGIKVGMLATRSPHRPNNIGLSLVKVVKVDSKLKRLHIAAFDLVHGTPVYDIKPVVPWDLPGHHDKTSLTVPSWVSEDDALRFVEFTPSARDSLKKYIDDGRLSPLYTSQNDGLNASISTICEVLAQDPRASNTNSSNKRGKNDGSDGFYKIVFCKVEVLFRVSTKGVLVEDITDLDLDNVMHVDGIPVLLEASLPQIP